MKKNEFEIYLVSCAQKPAGKFVLAALFGAIIFLSSHSSWLLSPFIVLVFSFFRSHTYRLIFLFNIIFWYAADALFSFKSFFYPFKNINLIKILSEASQVSGVSSVFPTTLGIIFLTSLLWIYKKLRLRASLLFLFSSVVLLILISVFLKSTSYFITVSIILVVMKSFWFWCYAAQNDLSKFKLHDYFSSLSPFWMHDYIRTNVMPRGYSELRANEAQNSQDFAVSQIKGIKLAFYSLVFFYLSKILICIFYDVPLVLPILGEWSIPSLKLQMPLSEGLGSYASAPISISERWLSIFVIPLVYIFHELCGTAALLVSFVRLLGFNIKRPVYRPYEATHFNEFFQRIYFYYNSILLQFFFMPAYLFVSRFNLPKKVRLILSVVFAICVGGLLVGYLRGSYFVAAYGPVSAIEYSINRLPYFIGLAIASSFSILKYHPGAAAKLPPLLHYIRLVGIYGVYALCFSLQGNIVTDSFYDRWLYFCALFGL